MNHRSTHLPFDGQKTCEAPECERVATRGGSTSDGRRYVWTCSPTCAENMNVAAPPTA